MGLYLVLQSSKFVGVFSELTRAKNACETRCKYVAWFIIDYHGEELLFGKRTTESGYVWEFRIIPYDTDTVFVDVYPTSPDDL